MGCLEGVHGLLHCQWHQMCRERPKLSCYIKTQRLAAAQLTLRARQHACDDDAAGEYQHSLVWEGHRQDEQYVWPELLLPRPLLLLPQLGQRQVSFHCHAASGWVSLWLRHQGYYREMGQRGEQGFSQKCDHYCVEYLRR